MTIAKTIFSLSFILTLTLTIFYFYQKLHTLSKMFTSKLCNGQQKVFSECLCMHPPESFSYSAFLIFFFYEYTIKRFFKMPKRANFSCEHYLRCCCFRTVRQSSMLTHCLILLIYFKRLLFDFILF